MAPEDTIPRHDAELIAAMARLEGKVDQLAAVMDATQTRARDELAALFETRREHADRIGDIQRDYVPRRQFERHESEQRDDVARLFKAIDGIKTQVIKVVAVGGALLVAANLMLRMWGAL